MLGQVLGQGLGAETGGCPAPPGVCSRCPGFAPGRPRCLFVAEAPALSPLPPPGVLHSGGADFESEDELFEAVGELLQDVSRDSKDDEDIRDVCRRMYDALHMCVPAAGGRQGPGGCCLRPPAVAASRPGPGKQGWCPGSFPVDRRVRCRDDEKPRGCNQVLLDAPIQLSQITDGCGEEAWLRWWAARWPVSRATCPFLQDSYWGWWEGWCR